MQSFPHVNKFTHNREIKCAVLSAPPSTIPPFILIVCACATIASQYQTSHFSHLILCFNLLKTHTNLWCNPPECFEKLPNGNKKVGLLRFNSLYGSMSSAYTSAPNPLLLHYLNKLLQAGHLGCRRKRWRYSEIASQCLQRKARRITRSSVESVRLRVFINGTTQLATVDTNTKRTAMTASSTLISFPRRVRAVAFSKPSSCTTCCCCCCSSILEIRVWHASSASCRSETKPLMKWPKKAQTLWKFWGNLPEYPLLFHKTDKQFSPPCWLVPVSSSEFHSGAALSSH